MPVSLLSKQLLDDLAVKFIINNKDFILMNPEEYYFAIEQAYWFALDLHKINPLPLPTFATQLLDHCGIYVDTIGDFVKFKAYKSSIKVFGTMIFSRNFTHCLLVQQCGSSDSITFPKGKKSMNESGMQCAVRETLEEVGFNAESKIIDSSVTIFDKITFYFVLNVDMKTKFKTTTRNEIKKIFWFDLSKVNLVKNRKEYKIFTTAFSLAEKMIEDFKKAEFKFDLNRILQAVEDVRKNE